MWRLVMKDVLVFGEVTYIFPLRSLKVAVKSALQICVL
jgi:hypothetical protein